MVSGNSIAQAWENSLIKLYSHGLEVPTQYDKEGDPPSLDCTMIQVIDNPLSEPQIHKEMPGGMEDLQEYVMEVCDGIKDHWVRDQNDPNDKRWEYTYHDRLFNYKWIDTQDFDWSYEYTNQIENICQQLAKTPYTRRAQAITWKVWEDSCISDPACLQSIWCRIIDDTLSMNVRFRSRDAFGAAFMNIFALTRLQQKIAARISELSGKEIKVGRYCDISDSYHIYGKDRNVFVERFMKSLNTRTFAQRTFRYEDVKEIMDEYIPIILEKIKKHDRERNPVT